MLHFDSIAGRESIRPGFVEDSGFPIRGAAFPLHDAMTQSARDMHSSSGAVGGKREASKNDRKWVVYRHCGVMVGSCSAC